MIGVILVFVATGDLAGTLWVPLTDQGLQGMANRAMPPLGNLGSQRGTETESSIRFEQPTKAAIGGEVRTVKPGLEGGRGEATAGNGSSRSEPRPCRTRTPETVWRGRTNLLIWPKAFTSLPRALEFLELLYACRGLVNSGPGVGYRSCRF